MKKAFPILLLLLFIGAGLMAQTEDPSGAVEVIPSEPFLKKAPSVCQWTITYSKVPAASETRQRVGALKPASVVVTKANTVVLEEITDEGGHTVQVWKKEGLSITKTKADNKWTISRDGDPFSTADYVLSDFAGFSWLSKENYIGTKEFQGQKCYFFKSKFVTLSPGECEDIRASFVREGKDFNPADFSETVIACISSVTRLPVFLKYGNTTRSYAFKAIGGPELSLPPEAANASAKYLAYISRISADAAMP
jgi:hypothetical protein